MVNRCAPTAAEYVVRRVLTLPKVSENFGLVSFKRGVSLPISSEVTALFPVRMGKTCKRSRTERDVSNERRSTSHGRAADIAEAGSCADLADPRRDAGRTHQS